MIVGESESAVFMMFSRARSLSPCILFIDQIDTLVPVRGTSATTENTSDRIVTLFLTGNFTILMAEMDGFFSAAASSVVVLASTK